MIDMMGQGVFAGVAAPVVGAPVVVLGLHLAPAQAAVQPTAEHVGVQDPQVGLSLALSTGQGRTAGTASSLSPRGPDV